MSCPSSKLQVLEAAPQYGSFPEREFQPDAAVENQIASKKFERRGREEPKPTFVGVGSFHLALSISPGVTASSLRLWFVKLMSCALVRVSGVRS